MNWFTEPKPFEVEFRDQLRRILSARLPALSQDARDQLAVTLSSDTTICHGKAGMAVTDAEIIAALDAKLTADQAFMTAVQAADRDFRQAVEAEVLQGRTFEDFAPQERIRRARMVEERLADPTPPEDRERLILKAKVAAGTATAKDRLRLDRIENPPQSKKDRREAMAKAVNSSAIDPSLPPQERLRRARQAEAAGGIRARLDGLRRQLAAGELPPKLVAPAHDEIARLERKLGQAA